MKFKNVIIAVSTSLLLASGSASAISFDIADIDFIDIGNGVTANANGLESDGTPVLSGAEGDVIDQWVAIEVTTAGVVSSIKADASATNDLVPLALATDFFDITLYNATVAGTTWTTDPDPAAAIDAIGQSLSPLEIGLSQGFYLLNYTGTLNSLLGFDTDWDYNVRISSAVPVPAAVWLFGTAIMGLIGLRRRNKELETATA